MTEPPLRLQPWLLSPSSSSSPPEHTDRLPACADSSQFKPATLCPSFSASRAPPHPVHRVNSHAPSRAQPEPRLLPGISLPRASFQGSSHHRGLPPPLTDSSRCLAWGVHRGGAQGLLVCGSRRRNSLPSASGFGGGTVCLGSLLTSGEGRAGTSPAPGQDRLQRVQRNTSRDGRNAPSVSSERAGLRGRGSRAGGAGGCGGPEGAEWRRRDYREELNEDRPWPPEVSGPARRRPEAGEGLRVPSELQKLGDV